MNIIYQYLIAIVSRGCIEKHNTIAFKKYVELITEYGRKNIKVKHIPANSLGGVQHHIYLFYLRKENENEH